MLKSVVDAGLPLVAIRTRDTVNLVDVLENLTGKKPVHWTADALSAYKAPMLFYVVHPKGPQKVVYGGLYRKLMAHGSTLIVVNPLDIEDEMFNAGELPVPKTMVHELLMSVTENEDKANDLMKALGGVTLKEAAELSRLTMVETKALTSAGIMTTRKQFFQGQPGLTLVDPAQPFYLPSPELDLWVTQERQFFFEAPDTRLMPRGLLFDGPPGVGKTSGAKYIAEKWGVPLYRMDIGATKNKFVGESENNLMSNLSRLDHEEPCVALFDEIEKVFAADGHDSSGITTTMMSQILWWLAERRTRVLVVMTTNAAGKLPKELHREGRIDRTMVFKGLTTKEAEQMAYSVAQTFGVTLPFEQANGIAKAALKAAGNPQDGVVSHALVTGAVYGWMKEYLKV